MAHCIQGGLLGELNLVDPRPLPWLAGAIVDCTIRVMDPDVVRQLAETEPGLAFALLESLGKKTRMLGHQVEELSFRPVSSRVARVLLAAEQKARDGCPSALEPGLVTHDDMAAFVRTSRETVGRTLQFMRSTGIIKYRRNLSSLAIVDHPGLERMASEEL